MDHRLDPRMPRATPWTLRPEFWTTWTILLSHTTCHTTCTTPWSLLSCGHASDPTCLHRGLVPLRAQKASSHFQWRIHASAFLGHWTSSTLSLQGGQIAEWIPIISSAVRKYIYIYMEMFDQTLSVPVSVPALYQDDDGAWTPAFLARLHPVSYTFPHQGTYTRSTQAPLASPLSPLPATLQD